MIIHTSIVGSAIANFSYETTFIDICHYLCVFYEHLLLRDTQPAVSGLSESALLADYSAWKDQRVKKSQESAQPALCTFNYSSYPCLLSAGAKKRILLEEVKQRQILAQHFALATAQLTGQGNTLPCSAVLCCAAMLCLCSSIRKQAWD